MEESVSYPKSGYIRQRRNLIGISLMLLAYLAAGISVEQINVLGNEFTVRNPSICAQSAMVDLVLFSAAVLSILAVSRSRRSKVSLL